MIDKLAVCLFVLVSCARAPSVSLATIHGQQGPVRVHVETADSDTERELGLMGRTSLAPDNGMVFVFGGDPVTASFWMKDTLIPLSIAFWSADGTIVAIHDMDPCPADPCPTFGSPSPYVGALEVNQGFFSEHGVRVGDRIQLS